MDEEKIWQKEWFKIPFKDLNIRLSPNILPDQKFYDSFYDFLFKKYLSWNDLPVAPPLTVWPLCGFGRGLSPTCPRS